MSSTEVPTEIVAPVLIEEAVPVEQIKEEVVSEEPKPENETEPSKPVEEQDEEDKESESDVDFEEQEPKIASRKRGRKAYNPVEKPTRRSTRIVKPVERLHSSSLMAPTSKDSRNIARMIKMIDLACSIESGENVLPPPGSASKASKPQKSDTELNETSPDVKKEDGDTTDSTAVPPSAEDSKSEQTVKQPKKKSMKMGISAEEEDAILTYDYASDSDDSDDDDFVKYDTKSNGKKVNGDDDDDDDSGSDNDVTKKREKSKNVKKGTGKRGRKASPQKIKMKEFDAKHPEFVFPASEIERLSYTQKNYLRGLKSGALKSKLISRGISPNGKKSELISKIAHCFTYGIPPKCPVCKNGTLRMTGMSSFACTGFYVPEGKDTLEKCEFVGENLELKNWIPEDNCPV